MTSIGRICRIYVVHQSDRWHLILFTAVTADGTITIIEAAINQRSAQVHLYRRAEWRDIVTWYEEVGQVEEIDKHLVAITAGESYILMKKEKTSELRVIFTGLINHNWLETKVIHDSSIVAVPVIHFPALQLCKAVTAYCLTWLTAGLFGTSVDPRIRRKLWRLREIALRAVFNNNSGSYDTQLQMADLSILANGRLLF